MRALVQRVSAAAVASTGRRSRGSGPGCWCCSGSAPATREAEADRLADKVRALRVFDDAEGRMNEPLGEREILCVSQFTLYGDARKGNRPSYVDAARPEGPSRCTSASASGPARGAESFGARMAVELVNDGPVTLLAGAPDAGLVAARGPRLYSDAPSTYPYPVEWWARAHLFFRKFRVRGGQRDQLYEARDDRA